MRNGTPVYETIQVLEYLCVPLVAGLIMLIIVTYRAITTEWWTVWYWWVLAVGGSGLFFPFAILVVVCLRDLIERGVELVATVTGKESITDPSASSTIYSIRLQPASKWEQLDMDAAERYYDEFNEIVSEAIYSWVNEGDEVVVTLWRRTGGLIKLDNRTRPQRAELDAQRTRRAAERGQIRLFRGLPTFAKLFIFLLPLPSWNCLPGVW